MSDPNIRRWLGLANEQAKEGRAIHGRRASRVWPHCEADEKRRRAGLVAAFKPFLSDGLVHKVRRKMESLFRDEEDEGPRRVADVEGNIGDARAGKKLEAFARVTEFLRALDASEQGEGGRESREVLRYHNSRR